METQGIFHFNHVFQLDVLIPGQPYFEYLVTSSTILVQSAWCVH